MRTETRREQRTFAHAYKAERYYSVRLRAVARMIDQLVRAFHPFDVESRVKLNQALQAYAKTLTPWAEATSKVMLVDIMRRDEKVWRQMSQLMGFEIRHELQNTPVGDLLRVSMQRQVDLITSLPLEAGRRIHEIAMGDLYTGARASELVDEILKTGHVTKSRAETIARTEVGRASSEMTKVRAENFGSEGYTWRTARDRDVRLLHKKLEGKFFKWTEPPITGSSGERSLPGGIYNCFPGDTLCLPINSLNRVFRAKYRGPLVVLILGETPIRVTPNHPILTPVGWVTAETLEEGDEVLSVSGESRLPVMENVNNRLRPIGEVFETGSLPRDTSSSGSVVNLYEDLIDKKVDIVRADFDLPLMLDPDFIKQFSDEVITKTHRRIIFSGEGTTSQVDEALLARCSEVLLFLLRSSEFGQQSIGLEEASDLDTVLGKNFSYSRGSSLVLNRKTLTPAPPKIRTYDGLNRQIITGVKSQFFDGHVYTLECDGSYCVSPAAVIVKNCRCYAEPVIPRR